MTKINTINIKDYNNFFFKEGQKAFNALVESVDNVESVEVENTSKALQERKKEKKYSISEWITELEKEKEKEKKDLIKKINEFVSYCDVNALGANEHSIEIGENIKVTAIAKAFVFQHIWVENILKYLLEPNLDNLPHSVRKAIEYFQNPKEKFPILSEGHREKIIEYYELKKNKNDQDEFDFDAVLIENAKKRWSKEVEKIDESNHTYIYTIQIYKERSQWDCKVDTTLLEKNYNLILTGAPGTGKTYLARQMAKKLTNENDNNIGFVQFHPSYDYTDFVEGLRPHEKDGNIVFKRENGVFKEFCKKAIENEKNKYVFIIDEINRGEISKIFGELFFSIDPGYRVKRKEATQSNANTKNQEETNKIIKVDTQYKNMIPDDDHFKKGFYVPDNVYIIGTMNDIDRSVESMDFAFRRRFAFQEITAEDTMDSILYQLGDDETIAINKMRAINNTLDKLGLNSNYHIGAAYFKKIENYKNKGKWDQLWNLHLKGTLFEYFRGEPEADKKLKELKEAYKNAGEN